MNLQPIPNASATAKPTTTQPPLLEMLRCSVRARGDSQPTADTHVTWACAFILFRNKRHPAELRLSAVTHFLEHVVKTAPDPLPSLAQARLALMLLYGGVLGKELGELPHPRPPRPLDQLRLVLRSSSLLAAHLRLLRPVGHAFHPLSPQAAFAYDGCS